MTVYMIIKDDRVVFTKKPKSVMGRYEVIEAKQKNDILFVKAIKKNYEFIVNVFSGEACFNSKEEALKFCSELKVKNPQDIIHEEKGFFGKTRFFIENQYVECQDGDITEIAITNFPIIDYAGVLKE